MNTQPITPVTPPFLVTCLSCGLSAMSNDRRRSWVADLDGPAFRAFFCAGCVPSRPVSSDERELVDRVLMWGSDAYPVRKSGRGWTWGTDAVKGPNCVFATKREAVASFTAFRDVIIDALGAEARHRAICEAARPRNRLFIGIYPTGVVYADRHQVKSGDYGRVAFLPFRELTLKWDQPEHPCRDEILQDAAAIIARPGELFQVSEAGQTVRLGDAARKEGAPME